MLLQSPKSPLAGGCCFPCSAQLRIRLASGGGWHKPLLANGRRLKTTNPGCQTVGERAGPHGGGWGGGRTLIPKDGGLHQLSLFLKRGVESVSWGGGAHLPWYAPWDLHFPFLLGGTKYFCNSCRACKSRAVGLHGQSAVGGVQAQHGMGMSSDVLEERRGGGGGLGVCVPKMARQDFPNGKFVFSHDGHFGLGGGGRTFLLRCTAILILPRAGDTAPVDPFPFLQDITLSTSICLHTQTQGPGHGIPSPQVTSDQ